MSIEITSQDHVCPPTCPVAELVDQVPKLPHCYNQRRFFSSLHVYRHYHHIAVPEPKHHRSEISRRYRNLFRLDISPHLQHASNRPRPVLYSRGYHLRPIAMASWTGHDHAVHTPRIWLCHRHDGLVLKIRVIHQAKLYRLLLPHIQLQDTKEAMHLFADSAHGSFG